MPIARERHKRVEARRRIGWGALNLGLSMAPAAARWQVLRRESGGLTKTGEWKTGGYELEDYGHHPVKSPPDEAARESTNGQDRRPWCSRIFTRGAANRCFEEFCTCFKRTPTGRSWFRRDVYRAGRAPNPGMTADHFGDSA